MSEVIKEYIIDSETVIDVDDIFKFAPIFSKSYRSKKLLAQRVGKFLFANKDKDNIWFKKDKYSTRFKDKIFVNKETIISLSEEIARMFNVDTDTIDNNDNNDIKEAPPIILLEDDEKFKCDGDIIYDVEVRGTRSNVESLYFKVKSVAEAFNIENLQNSIINNKYPSLDKGKDFTFFYVKNKENKVYKQLFLSYIGILKVIFKSRSAKAQTFTTWVSKIISTLQFGSSEKKIKLCSKVLKTDYDNLKKFLNCSNRAISCLYLMKIGTAQELRESMNIPESYDDSYIIYKYGRTKDLSRRVREHINTYTKINGVKNVELYKFAFIDPFNTSDAETYFRDYMKDINVLFEYETQDELIICSNAEIEKVKKHLGNVERLYIGHHGDLRKLVTDMEMKIIKKDFEIQSVRDNYKIELLKMELEMANLKLSMK